MRRLLFHLPLLLILAPGPALAQAALDPRVEPLLARMTIDEKVGQLNMVGFDEALGSDVLEKGGAGSVISFNDAAAIARAQQKARASRLGIPLLVGLDLLHGFRTLFPMPLAEAASFDPGLAARNAELAAREAVPAGLNWTFAPMIDVNRDARWGRAVEGSGEDVFLAADFAAARASGFRKGGLAATLKHFAGYGAVAGGRDYDAVSVSPYELHNVHFPPFAAALQPRLTTVMTALTVLNGMPSTAHRALIRETLRGKWRFDGVVVSDWKAIEALMDQGVAADGADAVRKAMWAGVDVDMMSGLYAKHLAAEVAAGHVLKSDLDAAVRRVLNLKFQLGLFDRPDPDPALAEQFALTPPLREAARQTVRDAAVLLRNEDGVLPLGAHVKRIALVGPFADNAYDQLGPHEAQGRPEEAVTILAGLRERAAKQGVEILYAPGCDADCTSGEGFQAAVDAARRADAVIAALGEKREHAGEGASRASLDFPGRQQELLDALAAAGKPVVLVIVAGRPLDLRGALSSSEAILMAWYPGTEGGHGLADLLFGDHAPSAKLPISWPRSVGQLPLHYDRPATGRPYKAGARYTQKFIDEDVLPLFPFGHGLTYTRFEYSSLKVVPEQAPAMTTPIEVSVDVRNVGERAGTEIVQLYIRDAVAGRVQPVRRLRGYRRTALAPGETQTVRFRLGVDDLSYRDESGKLMAEGGEFRIGVGADATVPLSATLHVATGSALSRTSPHRK